MAEKTWSGDESSSSSKPDQVITRKGYGWRKPSACGELLFCIKFIEIIMKKKHQKTKKKLLAIIFCLLLFIFFIILKSNFFIYALPNKNEAGVKRFIKLYEESYNNDRFDIIYNLIAPEEREKTKEEFIEEKLSKKKESQIYKRIIKPQKIVLNYTDNYALVDTEIINCKDKDCYNNEKVRFYYKWIIRDNRWFLTSEQIDCLRLKPYDNPPETMRAYDLAMEKIKKALPEVPFLDIKNCVFFEYTNLNEEANFRGDISKPDKLIIQLDHQYRNYDDLILSLIISHEIWHANEFLIKYFDESIKKTSCLESETGAFYTQLMFLSALKEEEIKSLSYRMPKTLNQMNYAISPLKIVWMFSRDIIYQSLLDCQIKLIDWSNHNVSQDQLRCFNSKAKENIKNIIKSSEYYQKQC